MGKSIDCVVCGSCVADILLRPVSLDAPIGRGTLLTVDPIEVTPGGIVSNSGIAMARLGLKVAALSYTGGDVWGDIVRETLAAEGIDTRLLISHPSGATSTTVVLIDPSGERSFAHCAGVPRLMNKRLYLENLAIFADSRATLLGYYSLMPNLEQDLPEVLAAIRQVGCLTAMDAAGSGGGMEPLDRILPHLDVYVPSLDEAVHQTGHTDPRKIVDAYRECGAPGWLGVKLGSHGALLSPAAAEYVDIPPVPPPGPVVDTTGAGDCFYAGLLAGRLGGMDAAEAGRLAATTAAHSVAGYGATAALPPRK